MTAQYQKIFGISGEIIKVFFCTIGILYAVKIIWDFYKYRRNKYTHKVLMKEIEDLDMIQHKHSLIMIKKIINQKETQFLLYYDEKWDCKLFLNYKTTERNNEQNIMSRIAEGFNVDVQTINCRYVASRVQEKYSVSHNEDRVYQHRLYEVSFDRIPEAAGNDDFIINDRHYYWMSISDMEKDANIVQKNLEVVDFVKENA